MKLLEFFSTHSWKFATNNVFSLHESLSMEDQRKFPFKMDNFDWHEYIENYGLGLRRYVMKDPDSTIPLALKRLPAIKYRTNCFKALIFVWLFVVGILCAKFGRLLYNRTLMAMLYKYVK